MCFLPLLLILPFGTLIVCDTMKYARKHVHAIHFDCIQFVYECGSARARVCVCVCVLFVKMSAFFP